MKKVWRSIRLVHKVTTESLDGVLHAIQKFSEGPRLPHKGRDTNDGKGFTFFYTVSMHGSLGIDQVVLDGMKGHQRPMMAPILLSRKAEWLDHLTFVQRVQDWSLYNQTCHIQCFFTQDYRNNSLHYIRYSFINNKSKKICLVKRVNE